MVRRFSPFKNFGRRRRGSKRRIYLSRVVAQKLRSLLRKRAVTLEKINKRKRSLWEGKILINLHVYIKVKQAGMYLKRKIRVLLPNARQILEIYVQVSHILRIPSSVLRGGKYQINTILIFILFFHNVKIKILLIYMDISHKLENNLDRNII